MTSKQDGNLKILAFSVSFIPIVITLLLVSGNLRNDFKAISLGFLCLNMFVIGCFILVIRNVYTIKTIGGYIATFYEKENDIYGWERRSSLVAAVYARYNQLPNGEKELAPRPWFILNGGTERTLSYFFFLLSASVFVVYGNFVIDLSWSALSPITFLLIFLNAGCVLFVLYLSIALNFVAKRWKLVWPQIDSAVTLKSNASVADKVTSTPNAGQS